MSGLILLLAFGFILQLLAIRLFIMNRKSKPVSIIYMPLPVVFGFLTLHWLLNTVFLISGFADHSWIILSVAINSILLASCYILLIRPRKPDPLPIQNDRAEEVYSSGKDILKKTDLTFRQTIEYSNDVFWILDRDNHFTYVSPSVEKMLGYTREEIMGMKINDLLPEYTYRFILNLIQKALETLSKGLQPEGKPREILQIRKDGQEIWTEVIVNPLQDEEGKHSGFLGVSRDIHSRKIQEIKMQNSYQFGNLVSQISHKIISARIEEIDGVIEYTLEQIGKQEDVDRCFISLFDDELNEISDTHEWVASGYVPQIDKKQNIWLNVFPFLSAEIKQHRVVRFDDISVLPTEADKDKKILEKQGVKALLMVPMLHEGQLLGIIGFELLKRSRQWEEEFIQFIKMVADIIANALMRKAYVLVLKESEERYKLLSNITFEGIAIHRYGIIVDCNESFLKIFQLKRDETIGRNPIRGFIVKEDYSLLEERMEHNEKYTEPITIKAIRRDGSVVFLETEGKSLKIDEETYRVISFRNVTSRIEAENALRESEAKFRAFNENLKGAVYTFDKDGSFHYVNRELCSITGYSNEELLNMHFWDLVAPEFLDLVKGRGLARVKGEEVPSVYEFRIKTKTGIEKWVEISNSKLVIGGEPMVLGTAIEITERKKAEFIQEVLYHISNAVGRSASLNEMFEIIHIEMSKLVDAPNFFIALYNKEKDLMELPYMRDEVKVFKSFPAGNTITSLVIRDKKSYFLKNEDIRKLQEEGLIRRYGPKAKVWMGVPLLLEGLPIGVMVMQSYDDADAYTRKDLELMETIAPQITLSIARKKNEEELRWSQRNLMDAQRVAHLGSWEWNLNTGVTFWSEEFYRICGMEPGSTESSEEIRRKIIHPDDRKMAVEAIEKMLEKGLAFNIEHRIILPEGGIRYVLSQGEILQDEQGDNEKVIGSYLDISERVIAERALKDSEEKYRILAESAPYGIIVHSDFIIEYANLEAARILGYEGPHEMSGLNTLLIIPEERKQEAGKRIESIYRGDATHVQAEEKVIKAGGGIIDLEVSNTRIYFNDKPAAQVIFRDITQQKKDQEQIRKLSSAVEKSPASVSITDKNGLIEYVNPRFTEVTGFLPEEVMGKTHNILKSGRHDADFYRKLWDTVRSGKVWQGEIYNRKKNGEYFWAEESISSLISDGEGISHYVALWQDITERKNMQEELIRAKEKAEEMNRIKSNFLATMSHELRTPLNGILGFAEILSNSIEDDNLKEMTEIINKSGQRLLETLNSILNLSALESNQLDLRKSVVDIKGILLDVKRLYIANANKKNIYLVTEFKTENTSAFTDGRFLRQVFNNLINNAIKYTNEGGVVVELSEETHNEIPGIVIRFIDTGIGISPENLDIIFDEFRQVSEGYNREFEGTGLGLSICKRYVDVLEGEISVESELGKGSIFTVYVPVGMDGQESLQEEEPQAITPRLYENPLKNRTPAVLLVEDEATNRQYVKIVLSNLNYDVQIAEDGPSALDMARKGHFDTILMDINLGKDMNGIQAMKEIRKIQRYRKVPIIAVTANAMQGHKEEFLAEGFDHYLSKPFNMTQLSRLIHDILVETEE